MTEEQTNKFVSYREMLNKGGISDSALVAYYSAVVEISRLLRITGHDTDCNLLDWQLRVKAKELRNMIALRER